MDHRTFTKKLPHDNCGKGGDGKHYAKDGEVTAGREGAKRDSARSIDP